MPSGAEANAPLSAESRGPDPIWREGAPPFVASRRMQIRPPFRDPWDVSRTFHDEQLAKLGPESNIAEDLKYLQSVEWKSKGTYTLTYDPELWFLVKRERVTSGWLGRREWEQIKSKKIEYEKPEEDALFDRAREIIAKRGLLRVGSNRPMPPKFVWQEIASGQIVELNRYQSSELDPVEAAILILSLYNDNFFDVPRVGSIEQGWRVDWIKKEYLGTVNYRSPSANGKSLRLSYGSQRTM